MRDFSFVNPTRIEFGKDKERKIGNFMAEFKAKKAVILYGSNRIKDSGLFDVAADSLRKNGIEFIECGGIKSNPLLSKAKYAIKLAKEFKADSVLAIGGASVLDTAKTVAAGACYDGDVWDYFTIKRPDRALMIFGIMTISASGSEMNCGGVITNEQTEQKYVIRSSCLSPKLSIINPQLQSTIDNKYLAYSAADIIAHSIEGYMTATHHPELLSMQVEANIKTVIRTTQILLKDPQNYDARGEFAWAATMALNGFTRLGISEHSYPNHMIEHSMSAITNCPHGAGLSVVVPAWMQWYKDKNQSQFDRFAREIFGLNSKEDGINTLKEWYKNIGTPTTLSELNIDEDTLQRIVQNATITSKAWGMDKLYTKESILEILNLAK